MKTVLIGIARMGSTRLPGKVLMDLGGEPVLEWVIQAGFLAPGVDDVWIATSTLPADDVIEKWCVDHDVHCFRGSETDVLSRFTETALKAEADVAIRVTCDCPFIDPFVIGQIVALRESLNLDYCSNIDPPTWPDGLDCEAITIDALVETDERATRATDRETVTQYIIRNKGLFSSANLTCPIPGLQKERWVLDTEDDYLLCQEIAKRLGAYPHTYMDILKFLNENPEVRELNKHYPRNERFYASLVKEEPLKRPLAMTKMRQKLTQDLIPLGTQTFSKSYKQYPQDAPLFVTHGDGGRVFDVDGNDYVDLVSGLLPNILGYRDPDVDFAIRQQLDSGISFSLASPLETEVAERLSRLIPCADMVRFGKNGTDVTTAAIRLARYVTGRSLVLSSGYHGWADWSIAHDPVRNQGVIDGVKEGTVPFVYGDTGTVQRYLDTRKFACVIVEPETDPMFLRHLRTACNATGTLLIFDEIITGFRFHMGGAQTFYGVTPDLATFGKSMANGMPISALVGHHEYMGKMPDICFSGTFFGETLSLAAACATIDKMLREDVLAVVHSNNRLMSAEVKYLQNKHGLNIMYVTGEQLPRLSFLDVGRYKASDIKTLYMQEMIKNGVLVINSFNLCYAHSGCDMERVAMAHDRAFSTIKKALASDNFQDWIIGPSISPSANVRYAS